MRWISAILLGVMLALSGTELAMSCSDQTERRDVATMLIGAGLVLRLGTGWAFLLSAAAAAAFRLRDDWRRVDLESA